MSSSAEAAQFAGTSSAREVQYVESAEYDGGAATVIVGTTDDINAVGAGAIAEDDDDEEVGCCGSVSGCDDEVAED